MDDTDVEPIQNKYRSHTTSTVTDGTKDSLVLKQRAKSFGAESTDSGFESLTDWKNTDVSSDKEDEVKLSTKTEEAERYASMVEERLEVLRQLQESHPEDPASVEGHMIETDNFVAAFLAEIGGNLSIPGTGVSLYVPPGALQHMQIVYITILPPTIVSGPKLQEKETWITPIVECGPTGLVFRKQVILKIPHCASSGKWKYTVHWATRRQSDWHQIQSHTTEVNGAVVVATNHFTLYGSSGEQEEEDQGAEESPIEFMWMKPVLHMQPINNQPNWYKVEVQICNIEHAQRVLPKPPTHSNTALRVKNSEEDIDITLVAKDESMIIRDPDQGIIPFKKVWSEYLQERANGGPSVTFTVKMSQSTSELNPDNFPPKFQLTVCQGKNKNTAVSMEVQAILQIKDITNKEPCEQQERAREERLLSRQPYYNEIDSTTLKFLQDIRFRKLCVILDGHDSCKVLASELGLKGVYAVVAINNVAAGERKSPSAVLLDDFFKESKDSDVGDTLRILSNALYEIDNNDARMEVEEEISQLVNPDQNYATADMNNMAEKRILDVENISQLETDNTQLRSENQRLTKENQKLREEHKQGDHQQKPVNTNSCDNSSIVAELKAQLLVSERYIFKLKTDNEKLTRDKEDLTNQVHFLEEQKKEQTLKSKNESLRSEIKTVKEVKEGVEV